MLEPGTRLGPYEIVGKLGEGGMGEVYRATDTRLGRTVAIKVIKQGSGGRLPASETRDERRERFEREAKAIAALNHPHICTLYDVGHEEPSTGSGQAVDFLVMEHLEGESLQDRLKKGALPLDQALTIAIQIADALDKAHRQGITHRDLKPGNVFLVGSGAARQSSPQAKLLDFGLAKLVDPARSARLQPSGDDSTKLADSLTARGTILGTFHYMAPEQLEGKEADARSDLWAFGCVVYEMVTGKKAFDGGSQASLIGTILKDEPRPLRDECPQAAPLLARIVAACLAKDPDSRFQSARDLRTGLEWVGEPSVAAAPASATAPMRERAAWLIALILAAVALFVSWGRGPDSSAAVLRTVVTLPEGHALRERPGTNSFAVSPDGRRIAFTASPTQGFGRLFVRDLETFESRPLTEPTDSILQPFFSPDGRRVGFESMGGVVHSVSADGGAPVELAQIGMDRALGYTWMEDGSIVFGSREGLIRLPSQGGTPEPITRVKRGETQHRAPHGLPGDRGVIFTVAGNRTSLAVLERGAGEPRILTDGENGFYVESGHLVFVSAESGSILAAPFELDTLSITGTPVPLPDTVVQTTGTGAGRTFAPLAVGRDGTMAYLDEPQAPATTAWVTRDGAVTPVLDQSFHTVRLSPDGRRFVGSDNVAGRLVVHDLDRETRLVVAESPGSLAVWSPDGSEVAYVSDGKLTVKSADGTGEPRVFLLEREAVNTASWSPDGRHLAFYDGGDILILALDTGEVIPFASTAAAEPAAAFSPDGRWLAYQSDETGRPEIYVQAFPGPGARIPLSSNGGKAPVWARDGTELFYREGTAMMAVAVSGGAELNPGRPERLFDGPFGADGVGHASYDVSPDGRFLMMTMRNPDVRMQIRVVVNLKEELERLVPPN